MVKRMVIAAVLMLELVGCGKAPIERIEWMTMGTVAAVQMRGANQEESAEVVRVVKATFAEVEKRLNAHDPNSELSRLAPLGEAEAIAQCDETMRPCYEAAFALAKASGGAFNPRWRGPGTLDFGAIAKGFAVDLAFERILYPKNFDLLIDLGGNLRSVKGSWRTGLVGTDIVVDLNEGFALATSAEYYRGKHIYDGRTGKPVSNEIVSVTVEASSAMMADALSTTLFVLGPDEGKLFLNEKRETVGDQVLWLMKDGSCITHFTHEEFMSHAGF